MHVIKEQLEVFQNALQCTILYYLSPPNCQLIPPSHLYLAVITLRFQIRLTFEFILMFTMHAILSPVTIK